MISLLEFFQPVVETYQNKYWLFLFPILLRKEYKLTQLFYFHSEFLVKTNVKIVKKNCIPS